MRFVVCYDISDDRRRAHVSAAMLDFGPRLQESVFLATLDDELFSRMMERLKKLIEPAVDCVHVFPLCQRCGDGVIALGRGDLPRDQEFYVV